MNTLKLDSRARRKVKTCPCGKSNKDGKFVPFKNEEQFGYCHACGETYFPSKTSENTSNYFKKIDTSHRPIDFIPLEIFEKYRQMDYGIEAAKEDESLDYCAFIVGLANILYKEGNLTKKAFIALCTRYQLTRSNDRKGIVFWQIDHLYRIRTGKIMWYDAVTCKRKQGATTITYVEKQQLKPDFNASACFFGEHLLSLYPNAIVGLVESEKTAIYMSAIHPNMVWLATGGKNGAKWTSRSVYIPLLDRQVVIFPDLDAHDVWTQKAKILTNAGIDLEVSSILMDMNNAFKSQYPKADIMDLGLIQKWHQKITQDHLDIIENKWISKPLYKLM